MASLQTALTARKDQKNTFVYTTKGTYQGTITDDGAVGDSILLKREVDMGSTGFGVGLVGAGTTVQIVKAHITGIEPQA